MTIPASEGHFDSPPVRRDPDAVALPDRAGRLVDRLARRGAALRRTLVRLSLRPPSSNFAAVAGSRSATGNPLQFGAPQVGYTVPSFFMEVDVHSPGFDFRGPALPGASLLVPLGRGPDFAWSLTTGASDLDDTRAERLCEPGGGRPTLRSTSYVFERECREMEVRTETIAVKNGEERTIRVFRTVHGPVIARARVDGDPVALVNQGAYWSRELDNVSMFAEINSSSTDSLEDFAAALERANASFNVIYTDAEHIAYFHVGAYPRRPRGVDPALPSWGTGRWEWRGFLPFEDHPQVVDPEQGFLVNWNNKPAVGWDNGQGSNWGPTQRVALLERALRERLERPGGVDLGGLVDAMREVATQDGRAVLLGPRMLAMTRGVGGLAADARTAVADWIAGGAHRLDRDRDHRQDFGPAVAVFDAWFKRLAHAIFDDEIGRAGYRLMTLPVSDDASRSNGSAYFADFSNYMSNLFHRRAARRYALPYCDDRGTARTESCAGLARRTLVATVKALARRQGRNLLSWGKPADYIEFSRLGAPSVDPIPWQNRGTYNHAVEVLGPRGAG